MDETYLTVAEVADLLKLNQQTVRNMIDRGDLRAARIGSRRVRIKQSDLDAFITESSAMMGPSEEQARAEFSQVWTPSTRRRPIQSWRPPCGDLPRHLRSSRQWPTERASRPCCG
jgi:excisionase family DNA binding protein